MQTWCVVFIVLSVKIINARNVGNPDILKMYKISFNKQLGVNADLSFFLAYRFPQKILIALYEEPIIWNKIWLNEQKALKIWVLVNTSHVIAAPVSPAIVPISQIDKVVNRIIIIVLCWRPGAFQRPACGSKRVYADGKEYR